MRPACRLFLLWSAAAGTCARARSRRQTEVRGRRDCTSCSRIRPRARSHSVRSSAHAVAVKSSISRMPAQLDVETIDGRASALARIGGLREVDVADADRHGEPAKLSQQDGARRAIIAAAGPHGVRILSGSARTTSCRSTLPDRRPSSSSDDSSVSSRWPLSTKPPAPFATREHVVARQRARVGKRVLTITTRRASQPLREARRRRSCARSRRRSGSPTRSTCPAQTPFWDANTALLAGPSKSKKTIGGLRFRVSAGSFFQVNVESSRASSVT